MKALIYRHKREQVKEARWKGGVTFEVGTGIIGYA
jgi:hypothetical protein